MKITDRDRAIAAVTMWAEARGESDRGLAGVAAVILNRAANPRWWGREGVASVCLAPHQFSCWWDAQRPRMLRFVDGGVEVAKLNDAALSNLHLLRCLSIWDRVVSGEIADPTGGATHYCTTAVWPATSWARGRIPSAVIGAHAFFRPQDIGEAPITLWRPSPAPVAAPAPEPRPEPRPAPPSPWAALVSAVLALFRRPA